MAQQQKNKAKQGQSLHVFIAAGGKPKNYKGAKGLDLSSGRKKK